MSQALLSAIAACLAAHAKSVEATGSDRPELDWRIDPTLREKIDRQRHKVEASLDGDPDTHRQHVEALTKGMRIVLRKLGEAKPAKPPPPVWDAAARRWVAS
jgi:hypothetical protein